MLEKHVWSSRRPSDQLLRQSLGIRRKQIRIGALSFARSHRRIVKRDKERWESGLSRGGVSSFKDVTPGPRGKESKRFVVFVAKELVVFEFGWERMSGTKQGYPDKYQTRFTKQKWP